MRLTDAEWKVMRQVWRHHPITAREVLEGLEAETGWAYSTVKTLLTRLTEKGALATSMRANTSLYEPLLQQERARRTALDSVLDTAFGSAPGSLMHMLLDDRKLSRRDRDELRRRLEALDPELDAEGRPRAESSGRRSDDEPGELP